MRIDQGAGKDGRAGVREKDGRQGGLRWVLRVGLLAATAAGWMAPPLNAAIPATERQVLLDFYQSTGGDGWRATFGWGGAPGTECSWRGVECDEAGGHVTKLWMGQNSLSGTLPESLRELKHLQFFAIYGESGLTGGIPSLEGLTELEQFWVFGCRGITGSLPALQGLSNLQVLQVADTSVSGEIPPLAGLDKLVEFDVHWNRLTGTIPELTGLASLEVFRADWNGLTGPIPSLTGIGNLEMFGVGWNRLEGPLPSLAGLHALTWFDASSNRLSGHLPELADAPALKTFRVPLNRLEGEIPALAGLAELEFFDVSHNELSGHIPPLSGLPGLKTFWVAWNRLSGPIPPLEGVPRLVHFDVSSNELTGEIPQLQGLDILTSFNVWNNQLTGSIPPLRGLRDLTFFDVGNNQLTGSIPSLEDQRALSRFNVAWNRLSGAVPEPPYSEPPGGLVYYWQETGYAGDRSGLCPNAFTPSRSATWDAATGEAPWYRNCVAPGEQVDLNQHGLTGSWAFVGGQVPGQGFLLEVFPAMVDANTAFLFASWFTYDPATGNPRWYTLEGHAGRANTGAQLEIYGYRGGAFASAQSVERVRAGTARFLASDCGHAALSYELSADASGYPAVGSIPLERLLGNANCTPDGDNGATGRQLLSGAWADPSHRNQGLLFDIDPAMKVFFAAWYSFLPDAAPDAGFDGQHWYTMNALLPAADFRSIPEIGIYETTGGWFMRDALPPPVTAEIGRAGLVFQGCGKATLEYQFAGGSNAGRVGTLQLDRVAVPPPGCSLD